MKGTYLIMLALLAMVVPSMGIYAGMGNKSGRKCHKTFLVTKCSKSKGTCRKAKVCVLKKAPANQQSSATSSKMQPAKAGCKAVVITDRAGRMMKIVKEACGKIVPRSKVATKSAATKTPEVEEDDDESIEESEELGGSGSSDDESDYDESYSETDESDEPEPPKSAAPMDADSQSSKAQSSRSASAISE
jgi:hypothetical protein